VLTTAVQTNAESDAGLTLAMVLFGLWAVFALSSIFGTVYICRRYCKRKLKSKEYNVSQKTQLPNLNRPSSESSNFYYVTPADANVRFINDEDGCIIPLDQFGNE
ncbi:hypothetical protein HELRODRAFT_184660, partial [Helobdella robusta]|uniref:Uncharacterized protein n=1 Tax=Helobdella robusta TaxID=6412 RepID=T1FLP9_HELRO